MKKLIKKLLSIFKKSRPFKTKIVIEEFDNPRAAARWVNDVMSAHWYSTPTIKAVEANLKLRYIASVTYRVYDN